MKCSPAPFIWVEDREQKTWLWIALLFVVFYFGEALLFWGDPPRVRAPAFTPLVYWGVFAVGVVWLVRRRPRGVSDKPASGVPRGFQAAVLGLGITAAVIGMTFLVVRATQDITLGHVVLLGTMFEAGIVIAGMSGSIGWMVAALLWGATALIILRWPSGQDLTLGLAVAIGFAVVGLVRKRLSHESTNGSPDEQRSA